MMTSTPGLAHTFEVFTLSSRPVHVQQAPLLYCELDALKRLAAQLNEDSDLERLKTRHRTMSTEVMQAYVCEEAARLLNLRYLPAIVIDKTWVAYGLDSEEGALTALESKREASQ